VCLALSASVAAAQDEPAEQHAKVTVAEANGPPDGQVVASIYLTSASGASIGALDVSIAFASDALSFVKSEPSGLAEGVGAKVTVDEARDAGETRVAVSISTLSEGGPRTALPEGGLVHVMLKIAKEAKHGSVVPLEVGVSAQTTDSPPRPLQVDAEDSHIAVTTRIVTTCFFYMH
jgi:hypothetical protein